MASRQPIILTDEIVPPPALIRAGMDALPSIIRAQGERASRRFIEFFTANICNRNTRMAYALAVRQFFDWCEQRGLALDGIRPRTVAAYIEQMRRRLRSRRLSSTWRPSGNCSTTGHGRNPAVEPRRCGAQTQICG